MTDNHEKYRLLRKKLEEIMFLKLLDKEGNYDQELKELKSNMGKVIRERIEVENDKNKGK